MRHSLIYFVVCVSVACAFTLQEANSAPSNDVHKYFEFPKDRHIKARIIGGKEAVPHAYPYQAAMFITTPEALMFCGGSLIKPDTVLTAAHCLTNASSVEVYLGYHSLAELGNANNTKLTAKSFYAHSSYDPDNFKNDIAIVKLPKNVSLIDTIKTVKLDKSSDKHENSKCLVSGWGLTNPNNQNITSRLRYVESTIMPNQKCIDFNPAYDVVKDSMICMNHAGHVGICSGDSGGPLIVDGKQVGIVSFGPVNCGNGPSVFTRVSEYEDWIDEHSGANNNFIKNSSYLLIIAYFIHKFIE